MRAEIAATDVAELPAAAKRARFVAETRDVEGDGGVVSKAAYDDARFIVLVAPRVIVKGQRVGAPREQRRAEAVVDCGRRVVIGTHAVSAPFVLAIATGGIGARVEVLSS